MGRFVINKQESGAFQFTLLDYDSNAILLSVEYTTKFSCDDGIEQLRKYVRIDPLYERCQSNDKSYYFCIKSPAGKVVAKSLPYKTVDALERGIRSARTNTVDATKELGYNVLTSHPINFTL